MMTMPTEMLGNKVRLDLYDMHVTSKQIDWERLEATVSHN
jgi:hypothetical protein